MVKCPACKRKFESNAEFYSHAREVHGSLEEAIYTIEKIRVPKDKAHEILQKMQYWTIAEVKVEVEGEEAIITVKKLRGVGQSRTYINVWDCHGTLVIDDKEEETESIGYFSVPKRIITNENKDKLEKLLWQVLEDNGSAINMSGIYYLDKEHLEELEKLIGV